MLTDLLKEGKAKALSMYFWLNLIQMIELLRYTPTTDVLSNEQWIIWAQCAKLMGIQSLPIDGIADINFDSVNHPTHDSDSPWRLYVEEQGLV